MNLYCTDKEGFRPVNNREARCLIFTFGVEVGCFLIDIIKLEYDPTLVDGGKNGYLGRVKTDRQIQMRSEHNSESLKWLGVFIHEAVHIWQRETKRHRAGQGGKDYEYFKKQLSDLGLKIEEHARAIEHWFYVNYGTESSMIDADNQISTKWLWHRILPVYGYESQIDSRVHLDISALRGLLKIWDPVIEEIRDPAYVPELRPKSPRFP